MGTLLKALFYGIGAIIIISFILANRASVNVSLVVLPEITMPLYVPIVIAFALGLFIGLLYAMRGAIAHRLALRRAKRVTQLPNAN